VNVALVVSGRPNLPVSQASVWRSISLAAGDVRQAASCGLYIATSVSATTDATDTLGLNRPKYRGCVTCTCHVRSIRSTSAITSSSASGREKSYRDSR